MSIRKLLPALASAALCAAPLARGQQTPPAVPDGPGKEQVAALCSGCHGLGRVMASGYRFDPQTERFQTWVIPSGGYIVRKMDVTPDGHPVIATSAVNGVGLVEVQ